MSDFADFGDLSDLGTGGDPPAPAPEAAAPAAAAGGPSSFEDAMAVAVDFVDAVVWGEHHKVWELIGSEGRTEVLDVATKRGMDEGLAARLHGDTSSSAETNEFLTDLVNGLRSELSGNDLDNVTFELVDDESAGDQAAVKMFVPLHAMLGGTLPIGTLYLASEGGTWRIKRLIPLTSK